MSAELASWPPANVAILDETALEAIREVQEAGTPDLIEETVALFVTSTPDRLAELEKAVTTSDAAAIRNAAHAVKGSCWLLGLTRLGKACEALELEGAHGRLENSGRWIERIRAEYELAVRALHRLTAR
jgi:HPt (histidine-containing phosphotransfer) domain-containing protein